MLRKFIFAILLAVLLYPTPARAAQSDAAVTSRDAYCVRDDGVTVGVVVAGTLVYIADRREGEVKVWSEKHGEYCWLPQKAFEDVNAVHADDIQQTLIWRTLVQRWLPDFPLLSEDLVLAVILKEGKGEANPVDVTGNDVRLFGQASVGPMAAIPRPNLPCYEKLTGPNAKDETACAIYLGMYILNSALQSAHEWRVGGVQFLPTLAGTLERDTICTTTPGGDYAVGWLKQGSYVGSVKTVQNGAGEITFAKVFDKRHERFCWISVANVQLEDAPQVEEHYTAYTEDDYRLGLGLYNCSAESLFADKCEPWGGLVYADDVLNRVLPEIQEALK